MLCKHKVIGSSPIISILGQFIHFKRRPYIINRTVTCGFLAKLKYIMILKILSIVVPLLIAVAYFTKSERKIIGTIQRRRGPNVVGFIGLLQPFS